MSLEAALQENTAALKAHTEALLNLGKVQLGGSPAAEKIVAAPEAGNGTAQAAPAPTDTTVVAAAAPSASAEASAKTLDYENDVKPVFMDYMRAKGVPAGQAFLDKKGWKALTAAPSEQWPAVIAEIQALTVAE